MIAVLRKVYDRFRGGGDYALSIPSLDGAYRPNSDLDVARVVAELRDAMAQGFRPATGDIG